MGHRSAGSAFVNDPGPSTRVEEDDRPAISPRLLLSFLAITLIWGSTWLVIKTQLGVVPTSWSVALRFLVGGGTLLIMCAVAGKPMQLGWKGHGFALLIALLQFVLNFNLVYRAEEHVTSGLVALVFALLIVPNALFSYAFLGQRISPGFAIGSVIGIAGVVLMFLHDLMAPGANGAAVTLGIAFALGAVLSASIANVMQATPLGRRLPLEGGLAWAMSYGGILNACVAWAISGPPVFDLSPRFVAGLGYLSLVASALAFRLYYALIREIGPGRAAYSSVIIPIVAMVLSTLFEGFAWTGTTVAGGLLAMLGLVVALRSRA